jgi:hypothetical protein
MAIFGGKGEGKEGKKEHKGEEIERPTSPASFFFQKMYYDIYHIDFLKNKAVFTLPC